MMFGFNSPTSIIVISFGFWIKSFPLQSERSSFDWRRNYVLGFMAL
jgi:hypothetical protein